MTATIGRCIQLPASVAIAPAVEPAAKGGIRVVLVYGHPGFCQSPQDGGNRQRHPEKVDNNHAALTAEKTSNDNRKSLLYSRDGIIQGTGPLYG